MGKDKQKRVCTFNENLAKEFPFIKKTNSDSNVRCLKCSGTFSLSHGGRSDITQHLKTEKHKAADTASASSRSMEQFFRKNEFGNIEQKLAATEGCWSYHTVHHNQTFRSTDCTSKIIQRIFEPKYSCARTKTEAIVCNVLSPLAMEELRNDLDQVHFLSVYSDASNRKEIKLFPIVVRYFLGRKGVQVKLLELKNQPGETSDIICDYILDTLRANNLLQKFLSFCADNTNTNFGGKNRKGKNNVFCKLNKVLDREVIGVGCAAHIVHNGIQTAADCLPVDVETIVMKIYSYFYIYTVRVETLKEFCDFVNIEYQKMLAYSKTRWLALMPAVERILKMFPALQSYFLSNDKCPLILRNFFESPASELWLLFIHSQAATFHSTVLKIEGQNVTVVEVVNVLEDLKKKLQDREESSFLPIAVRCLLNKLEEEGIVNREAFLTTARSFYEISRQYVEQWMGSFDEISSFGWILLTSAPTWNDVESSLDYIMKNKIAHDKINDNELFDEVQNVSAFVSVEQLSKWNNKDSPVPVDLRWVEIFTHFDHQNIPYKNMETVVEFCLCLPGTNAAVERVFSLMNNMWTSDKTQLKIETLKAMLITKCNFKETCSEFYDKIITKPHILKKIHGSEKYISM